ncbi:AAEL008908-PA [Aedes aegypti]|uniref:AAEL008908-PA n=1 Tax=Aedes aegypti TaxID=7159 RepID=Q16XD5_AEDAE|nr:AAEL008908-PA [Aedes aegypti]
MNSHRSEEVRSRSRATDLRLVTFHHILQHVHVDVHRFEAFDVIEIVQIGLSSSLILVPIRFTDVRFEALTDRSLGQLPIHLVHVCLQLVLDAFGFPRSRHVLDVLIVGVLIVIAHVRRIGGIPAVFWNHQIQHVLHMGTEGIRIEIDGLMQRRRLRKIILHVRFGLAFGALRLDRLERSQI